MIFRVPASNVPNLMDKLEKLNRKAAKLGCSPIETTLVFGEDEIDVAEGTGVRYLYLDIVGETPSYNGWTFVATLQHAGEVGNVVRVVPGQELPTQYRTASKKCDHCGYERNRKDTYVIRHEDGTYMQVGRNCIKDFLQGNGDPERIARWAEYLMDMEDIVTGCSGSGTQRLIYRDKLLEVCSTLIRERGWVSRTAVQNADYEGRHLDGTVSRALSIMFPPTKPSAYDKRMNEIHPVDADKEFVEAALEWLDSWKDNEDLNDYQFNLKVACSKQLLERRDCGIVGSLIGAYKRHLEGEKERKEFHRAGENSQFVGAEKDKIEFEGKVNLVRELPGEFGTTYMYIFESEGNIFLWYASRDQDLEEEQEVKIYGTVKKHQERQGIKQTVLTRCKVL